MQFWDYFTHFQWANAQPELRRELKAIDVGAFYRVVPRSDEHTSDGLDRAKA